MKNINPNDFIDEAMPPAPAADEQEPAFTNYDLAVMCAHAASAGAPAGKGDAFREQFVQAIAPAFELTDVAGALQDMGVEDLDAASLPAWVRASAAALWAGYMFVQIRKELKGGRNSGDSAGNNSRPADSEQQQQQSEWFTDGAGVDFATP